MKKSIFAKATSLVTLASAMLLQVQPALATNDPEFPNQASMATHNIPAAWPTATGNAMRVGIIDHSVCNILGAELPRTKFTYDWITLDPPPDADRASGVASAIAATTNNSLGIAGVAYNSTLHIMYGNLTTASARATTIVRALQSARNAGCRIVVLNLPDVQDAPNGYFYQYFQNDATGWQQVNDAMREFHDVYGGLIFMGAGNRNREDRGTSEIPYLIVCSSINSNDTRAANSNYGSNVWFGGLGGFVRTLDGWGRPVYANGTAFAAANCAGVAALVWSSNPTLRNVEVEQILKDTARKPMGAARNNVIGYGIPDAGAAVSRAALRLTPRNPRQELQDAARNTKRDFGF